MNARSPWTPWLSVMTEATPDWAELPDGPTLTDGRTHLGGLRSAHGASDVEPETNALRDRAWALRLRVADAAKVVPRP